MTLIDATLTPNFIASSGFFPLAKPKAKTPTNASPAPVVSTALTFGALTRVRFPSEVINTAPSDPKVTIEFLPGLNLLSTSSLVGA